MCVLDSAAVFEVRTALHMLKKIIRILGKSINISIPPNCTRKP